MSCFTGPNVIDDGLVLNLDAGNRKSFAGVGAERTGGPVASFNAWNGLVGTSTAYNNTKSGKPGVYLNITNANGGGVNWWNSLNGTPACLASTAYTITALVKFTVTPHPNLFYVRQYNASSSQTSESGKFVSSNLVPVGDGYFLTWTTFVTDSTAVSFLVQGYEYQNNQIWLEDVQCKRAGLQSTNSSVEGTAFTAMTRNSNGSLNYNGTTDYIDTGNTFTFTQAGQFSAELWLRILDHSDRPTAAAGIFGKGHYYDNQWDIWLHQNNSLYFETTGNPTRQGLVYLASPILTLSVWHHYVATYNNGLKTIYLNGVQVGSQTYSGPGDFSNSNNALIGRRFNDASRSLRGDIAVTNLYNKALTADEVRINFNALRSRFGL
jgi:hypothetical protein